MAEELPRQFGRYQLLSVVMRDGFGTVYRAHDTRYERDVWVRVLDADLASDPATAEQFERAARLASTVSHPNLPQVYEIGIADDLPFTSFQPPDGVSLAERLLQESPIFPLRAAFIVSQTTDALQHLHDRWLSHGNLHDRSIWLSPDDQVMLLDMGMAPGVHTPEGDTQALANLAHEMVVGAPFARTDDTMRRPGIPWRRAEDRLGGEMWDILMRGVGYQGKPYESVQAFCDDFVQAAGTAGPPPRESRRHRRRDQRARAQALAQQAGAAARLGQWERVAELAGHALRLNPKDDDARQWLRRAGRILGGEAVAEMEPLLRSRRRRAPVGLLLAALVFVGGLGVGIWALTRPRHASPPGVTATPSPRPTRTAALPTATEGVVIAPTATEQAPTQTPLRPTGTAAPTATATPVPPTEAPTEAPAGATAPPPTPTATRLLHAAPTPLAPADGIAFYGRNVPIVLRWSDAGPLAEDEWYVVRIPHPRGEEVGVTRETEWQVPAYMWWLRPPSARLFWSVGVRVRISEGVPGNADLWPAAGAESAPRSFVWLEHTPTPTATSGP